MRRLLFALLLPLIARASAGTVAAEPLAPDPARAPDSAALLSPLPAAPVMSRETLAGLAGERPSAPPAPSPPPSPPADDPRPGDAAIVMVPNADGFLDLSHVGEIADDDPIPNPFRLRYHPAPEIHDLPLRIGSVFIGDRPDEVSAIVNGQVYSPGESLAGLKIAVIGDDTLELVQGNIRVRLPIQDAPLTVRLSR